MGFIDLSKIQYKKEFKSREFRYNKYLFKIPSDKNKAEYLLRKGKEIN